MVFNAVSTPRAMSVPQISLSIEAGTPTTGKARLDKASEALPDPDDLKAMVKPYPHNGSQARIDARGVAARTEHSNDIHLGHLAGSIGPGTGLRVSYLRREAGPAGCGVRGSNLSWSWGTQGGTAVRLHRSRRRNDLPRGKTSASRAPAAYAVHLACDHRSNAGSRTPFAYHPPVHGLPDRTRQAQRVRLRQRSPVGTDRMPASRRRGSSGTVLARARAHVPKAPPPPPMPGRAPRPSGQSPGSGQGPVLLARG